jgi:hypothetical protein
MTATPGTKPFVFTVKEQKVIKAHGLLISANLADGEVVKKVDSKTLDLRLIERLTTSAVVTDADELATTGVGIGKLAEELVGASPSNEFREAAILEVQEHIKKRLNTSPQTGSVQKALGSQGVWLVKKTVHRDSGEGLVPVVVFGVTTSVVLIAETDIRVRRNRLLTGVASMQLTDTLLADRVPEARLELLAESMVRVAALQRLQAKQVAALTEGLSEEEVLELREAAEAVFTANNRVLLEAEETPKAAVAAA